MTQKQASPDDQWDVISEGARIKVKFDAVGDQFTGVWHGFEVIVNPNDGQPMEYANFTGITPGEVKGEPVAISASYQLKNDLQGIPEGSLVRLTLTRQVPTRKGNPLNSFKVETRRK